MADFVFDMDAEYPDVIVETMRQAVKQAIADLMVHAEQLGDSFLLGLTAFDFAQTVLTRLTTLQDAFAGQSAQITAQLQAQQQQIDALAAQLAALQPPPTSTTTTTETP